KIESSEHAIREIEAAFNSCEDQVDLLTEDRAVSEYRSLDGEAVHIELAVEHGALQGDNAADLGVCDVHVFELGAAHRQVLRDINRIHIEFVVECGAVQAETTAHFGASEIQVLEVDAFQADMAIDVGSVKIHRFGVFALAGESRIFQREPTVDLKTC